MKCACCGKKKRLFESFEELTDDVKICVECSKKLYKYQDAIKEKNEEDAIGYLKTIKSKKNSKEFKTWLESFIERISPKATEEKEVSTSKE